MFGIRKTTGAFRLICAGLAVRLYSGDAARLIAPVMSFSLS